MNTQNSHLPIPTEQQTLNYIAFFTQAHSWYKHLSMTEDTMFYFFLNPDVAKETVVTQERSFLKKEQSELTTTDKTIEQIDYCGHWFFCTENYKNSYLDLIGSLPAIGLKAVIHNCFKDPNYPEYYKQYLEQKKKLEEHLIIIIGQYSQKKDNSIEE